MNYNIGGLYNLRDIQYDNYPHGYVFPDFKLFCTYKNKIYLYNWSEQIELLDTITHINFRNSNSGLLGNLPNSFEFLRIMSQSKNFNFPSSLKELHIFKNYFYVEELKIPFNCNVNITNQYTINKILHKYIHMDSDDYIKYY